VPGVASTFCATRKELRRRLTGGCPTRHKARSRRWSPASLTRRRCWCRRHDKTCDDRIQPANGPMQRFPSSDQSRRRHLKVRVPNCATCDAQRHSNLKSLMLESTGFTSSDDVPAVWQEAVELFLGSDNVYETWSRGLSLARACANNVDDACWMFSIRIFREPPSSIQEARAVLLALGSGDLRGLYFAGLVGGRCEVELLQAAVERGLLIAQKRMVDFWKAKHPIGVGFARPHPLVLPELMRWSCRVAFSAACDSKLARVQLFVPPIAAPKVAFSMTHEKPEVGVSATT
jgi:hypothetical protein